MGFVYTLLQEYLVTSFSQRPWEDPKDKPLHLSPNIPDSRVPGISSFRNHLNVSRNLINIRLTVKWTEHASSVIFEYDLIQGSFTPLDRWSIYMDPSICLLQFSSRHMKFIKCMFEDTERTGKAKVMFLFQSTNKKKELDFLVKWREKSKWKYKWHIQ